jgi:hypothetical protein
MKGFICFFLNSLSVTNYFLLFNHLFVFFEFLISYKLFIILVINLSVLCLVPCPVFVWGPPGLLATGSCCWVVWGLRSLSAAFPCWSCLSYFKVTLCSYFQWSWAELTLYLKKNWLSKWWLTNSWYWKIFRIKL